MLMKKKMMIFDDEIKKNLKDYKDVEKKLKYASLQEQ